MEWIANLRNRLCTSESAAQILFGSCQDRAVGGGAGFFGKRLGSVARNESQIMVSKDNSLSVRRQCALLTLARSILYYRLRYFLCACLCCNHTT